MFLPNKWYVTLLPFKSGIFWITIVIQNKVSTKVNSTTYKENNRGKLERIFRDNLRLVHNTIFQENVLSVKLNFSKTVPGSEMSN